MDILRVEGYRKFCNKLWNATKLTLKQLGDDYKPAASAALSGDESLAEKYILSRLNSAVREANRNFEGMNFMVLTNALYQLWLSEFCDIFLEVQKPILAGEDTPENLKRKASMRATMYTCLDFGLRLLHPFMPFITEELYQRMPRRAGDTIPTIMLASYPQEMAEFKNEAAEKDFATIVEIVRAARSLMTDYDLKSGATGGYRCRLSFSEVNKTSFQFQSMPSRARQRPRASLKRDPRPSRLRFAVFLLSRCSSRVKTPPVAHFTPSTRMSTCFCWSR